MLDNDASLIMKPIYGTFTLAYVYHAGAEMWEGASYDKSE